MRKKIFTLVFAFYSLFGSFANAGVFTISSLRGEEFETLGEAEARMKSSRPEAWALELDEQHAGGVKRHFVYRSPDKPAEIANAWRTERIAAGWPFQSTLSHTFTKQSEAESWARANAYTALQPIDTRFDNGLLLQLYSQPLPVGSTFGDANPKVYCTAWQEGQIAAVHSDRRIALYAPKGKQPKSQSAIVNYCPIGERPNFEFWEIRILPVTRVWEAGEQIVCPPHYGYAGDGICINSYSDTITETVSCPVDPPIPLEEFIDQYHRGDEVAAENTRALERGEPAYTFLNAETKTAEQCLSEKFQANNLYYRLSSTYRTEAYQAHLQDIFTKWRTLGELEDPLKIEACRTVREAIEAEVGRAIGAKNCTVAGGRNHCIVSPPAEAESGNHPKGDAFDLRRDSIQALEAHLAKYGPPKDTVQTWVNVAPSCGLKWGGEFGSPDPVHFQRQQLEQEMLETLNLLFGVLVATAADYPPEVSTGEPVQARVQVTGEHLSDGVVYHFTVTNLRADFPIGGMDLGSRFEKGVQYPTLDELPVGSTYEEYIGPGTNGEYREWVVLAPESVQASTGWKVDWLHQEGIDGGYLYLLNKSGQGPGEIMQLSVKLPKRDPSYVNSGFTARFRPRQQYWGEIEKLDTQAPVLELSVDESTLWPPNGKLRPIRVNVSASDDFDPAPEVRLVSITANEPLSDGDVTGAEIGSDDREFALKATRSGNNVDGRIYTITYEALDALGNSTIEIVEVVVPRVQRGASRK